MAEQILAAVEPAALASSLLALADVERERAELTRHGQLRRERAHFEAERQYRACAPENRLVGRTLEGQWELALRQARQLEDEYDRWRRTASARVSEKDRDVIRTLAANLPAVWQAATTGPADRQRVARLLLERVTVTVDRASERVDVTRNWAGGQTSQHVLMRPVNRYDRQTNYPRLVERLQTMVAEHLSSATVAQRLNAEGFRPPKRVQRFTGGMV